MTAISAHGIDRRLLSDGDLSPDIIGRMQAEHRAGDWPEAGTLVELQTAVDRAVREARRVTALEYRWVRRHRLWERPEWSDAIEEHAVRLKARRERAREIAEGREQLLRRLLAEAEGRA